LPIGAVLGLASNPSQKITSGLMAFGGGALLFALTIELFGVSLHHSDIEGDAWIAIATVFGAIGGGVFFELLNRMLNAKGGFLRKHSLAQSAIEQDKARASQEMLKSLSQVPLLQALPAEEIARLVPSLAHRHFNPGDVIFNQGEDGLELYFIDKGRVQVQRKSPVGVTELAELTKGDVFGEMALVSDQPRTATVSAIDHVHALSMGKADFLDLLRRSSRLQDASKKIVLERLQNLNSQDPHFKEAAIQWHSKALEHFNALSYTMSTEDLRNASKEHKGGAALAIWLGIALDGIPESLIIGMLVTAAAVSGSAMSLAFIAGVFLANLPEAMSSAVTMKRQGKSRLFIMLMWVSLAVLTALGALAGSVLFPPHPEGSMIYLIAAIEGVAAGAMLTMIANTMLPEAFEQGGGTVAGLATLLGFIAALGVKLLR
jgi:zinc transporter ZupT